MLYRLSYHPGGCWAWGALAGGGMILQGAVTGGVCQAGGGKAGLPDTA